MELHVFLDLKKAFDIAHSIILRKLNFMVSNKKPLNGFSRILTIDNNFAVSMDTCQTCEKFHVGYPREAILVHCSSLYIQGV